MSYAVGGELKKAVTPNELREELHMIQNLPHKQEGDEGKGKLRGRKKKKEGAGES